ncbi:flavin reductase family protein [Thermomonospora curvata]|uniref:flavin reductase family protein n=1 Tax=Thermomonospora curvata TaxID=2020 RepID=UPI00032145EF|nr:flavin reductase family protein [Thermomonospora curvata]
MSEERLLQPSDQSAVQLDPREFRRVLGRFATGVAIVSTVADGVDYAMTINAFTSVSLDPLLVLFCADKNARLHGAVLKSGRWAVSVLPESARDLSEWFATRGRPLDGRLGGHPFTRGEHTGAAIFTEALAALECRTHAVHDGGDHSIVVGRVLAASTPAPQHRPLLYFEGRYRTLA